MQEGTMEMRDEKLSSVGAQDMDTSKYQVSNPDADEFHWKIDQVDVDVVSRPGKNTPFFTSTFNHYVISSVAENPTLIDEEQVKENSPPLPTIPVSERPTQPSELMRSCLFGTWN